MSNIISLTDEQSTTLRMVLLMTTDWRKREVEACQRLAQEIGDNGLPRYPNMQSNGEWWEKANKTIEDILEILRN